MRELSF